MVFTILGIGVEIHSSFGGFSCKIFHFQCSCNNMAAALQLATISYGVQKNGLLSGLEVIVEVRMSM